jgi:hypothetical protein
MHTFKSLRRRMFRAGWLAALVLLALCGCSGRDGEMITEGLRRLSVFVGLLAVFPALAGAIGLFSARGVPPGEAGTEVRDPIGRLSLQVAIAAAALMLFAILVPYLAGCLERVFPVFHDILSFAWFALLAIPVSLFVMFVGWIVSLVGIFARSSRLSVKRCSLASLLLAVTPLILALALWLVCRAH